ncbi:circularly permuted type 2 ATP-grasp protein, partial [Acinetobacter baumannii]|nr:circularly permuted type 2 ATP-grasp protein [Acinetobacter baumannii]
MSEQEKDLKADIDYFIQEQATNALLNQTSFIENLSVQSNLFEQLKSQFFNEMLDDATSNGVASKKIEQWLSIRTLDELKPLYTTNF